MYNETIIRFGFCDIQNNQEVGTSYQPQPSAPADNPYTSTLIILDITKPSSNNCLLLFKFHTLYEFRFSDWFTNNEREISIPHVHGYFTSRGVNHHKFDHFAFSFP